MTHDTDIYKLSSSEVIRLKRWSETDRRTDERTLAIVLTSLLTRTVTMPLISWLKFSFISWHIFSVLRLPFCLECCNGR